MWRTYQIVWMCRYVQIIVGECVGILKLINLKLRWMDFVAVCFAMTTIYIHDSLRQTGKHFEVVVIFRFLNLIWCDQWKFIKLFLNWCESWFFNFSMFWLFWFVVKVDFWILMWKMIVVNFDFWIFRCFGYCILIIFVGRIFPFFWSNISSTFLHF